MRTLLMAVLFALLAGTRAVAAEPAKVQPSEAARLVATNQAVLVDVREPSEWKETGVAVPATLLSKGAFDKDPSADWKAFLEQVGQRTIILYCRSGHRAGIVAAALESKGYKTLNMGGLKDWVSAGLPVRKVEAK